MSRDIVSMRNKAIIAGVGRTPTDRQPGADYTLHMGRALRAASVDAGITLDDIDGVMINLAHETGAMDKLPEMLGLNNVSFAFQSWAHGRMQPTCIAVAAWAIMTGQANYVACMSTAQRLGGVRAPGVGSNAAEPFREGGGPHLENPPYGLNSVGGGAAIAVQKYLSRYGGSADDLAAIALAQREWAQLQPDAFFHGRPLAKEEYLTSPMVVEPLRVYDHCIAGNAAFCIIVTSADRAVDLPKLAVYISGYQGSASGRETFVFSRTGLGIGQQSDAPYVAPEMPAYLMAGVDRSDVGIVGILDAFSPLVLFGLEEFGFCGEGEALSFVQDRRIAPGGELPVNTCGGGLSDVESFGWGHEVDMVRQLRGEAGAAQVPGVEVCQYLATDRSTVILTNGR